MAAAIHGVNEEMKLIPDAQGIYKKNIEARDELLNKTVIKLAEIMEDMGNLSCAHGCVTAIDERVSKVPFEIIIEGLDEYENTYE